MNYLSRIFVFSLLTLFISIQLAVPTQAQTSFDRVAMLEGIVTETVLPLHMTFAEEALVLETTAITFEADPTEENLLALRQAYLTTALAFEHISVYRFRRVMIWMSQIERYPSNVSFVEATLTELTVEEITPDFASSVGSAEKGLPVLDYLLFAEDALTLLTTSDVRRAYTTALAINIREIADILVEAWTPDEGGYADNFMSADGEPSSVRSAISMLSNEIIASLEVTTADFLGAPLGYDAGGTPNPALVKAPYSETSIARLIAYLEGVQFALNGLEDAPSLANYLDFIEAEYEGERLTVVINTHIDTAINNLNQVEQPLHITVVEDTEEVVTIYNSFVAILRLVKTDMANQLGITVTFSDNDGD
ncbi:MAG: imelysin family protein [Chloroflexota bacterium]